MLRNMKDVNILEDSLNKFIEKTVIVKQCGFIESAYSIEKMKYLIEYDILKITDKNLGNYININLNQIYKMEDREDKLIFYLDNDMIIMVNLRR